MADQILIDELLNSDEASALTNSAAKEIKKLEAELQNAVNERNQAWFELEEKQDVPSFQGVAETTKIDGFDMISINGDGGMISTDNAKPNAVDLVVGKRYEITVKLT